MTRGQLYDLVHSAAEAAGLTLVGMKVGTIGYNFELTLAADSSHDPRKRRGWTLNNGDIEANKPFDRYVAAQMVLIATALRRPPGPPPIAERDPHPSVGDGAE